MRRWCVRTVVGAAALGLVGSAAITVGPVGAASVTGTTVKDPAGGAGSFLLTATNTGPTYAPTFTGNGELGIRVPPEGQGYVGGTVPTQSELAGFYAQPPSGVQQRANIPTWSTLTFSDGGQPFTLSSGRTTQWRQSIDLRTGVITTTARWTAPDGHVTDLSYQVLTDRARAHVGLVRLTLTPRWTGSASVTDMIDGSPATLSTEIGKGWVPAAHRDWVSAQAQGTGINVAIASQLTTSGDVKAATASVDETHDQSVGQQLSFPVAAGHSYTVTKHVGVESSPSGSVPVAAAESQASAAASVGFRALLDANDAAWATLWSGRIDVLGNTRLATEVNAGEFYLWSSTRSGVDWSISPSGLSSNGYNGHIFWDAETWMYPALLAQHPDLAVGIDNYRYARLAAAQAHAVATGYRGSRYPWESALDGTEQIPPPVSLFTEGLYEQHVTSDIALAQWQYYEATGDKTWLARRGWPLISQAATFWASRVVAAPDGTYHIDGVTGPDEENADVNDEVYTNAAAVTVLRDAALAARVLGHKVPAIWTRLASRIVVPTVPSSAVSQEFAGYRGQLIKQADATLLEYPLGYGLPTGTAEADVNYYAPRTDPGGPSMSDAINAIDTSASATPGCASYVDTERSVEPFVRDVFDQFSETRTGGAFTFMTGIGGFLQEFLYGYSGLRWSGNAVELSPGLTSQLKAIVLRGVAWHGRRFTVTIGPHTTTVAVTAGGALAVKVGSAIRDVGTGHSLSMATRRPDLTRTSNLVRCAQASATSAQSGSPALAAVDGSQATGWEPLEVPAALTVSVSGGPRMVGTATLTWGRQWPSPPAPNVAPPAGPVTTLRPGSYTVAVSADGARWHTVATVGGRTGTTDVVRFGATTARAVKITMTSSTGSQPPELDELTVGR